MDRRKFTLLTSLVGISLATKMPVYAKSLKNRPKGYKLNYAPHLGMFENSAGNDPIDQINFMADNGFNAFEDNGMKKRSIPMQNKIADVMAKREMKMGVFVAHEISWKKPNLASGDLNMRIAFLKQIKKSIEVAKRINARWMTVVPGHLDLRKKLSYQTANIVESLKLASDLLEPHGLIMVLEPLNFRDHPGLFLTESPQAYEICKAVNSPSCKILFDVYHQQIQEGNLIPNIDKCWEEIAYFQIGDNPGRNEPTTGEINYSNIFKFIYSKGYEGVLGMEHGNSIKGIEGEKAVIDAYKKVDSF